LWGINSAEQHSRRFLPKLIRWLRHDSQRRPERTRPRHIVEANNGDVLRDADTAFVERLQHAERQDVVRSEDRGRALGQIEQFQRQFVT
jgi:hypothetical protein